MFPGTNHLKGKPGCAYIEMGIWELPVWKELSKKIFLIVILKISIILFVYYNESYSANGEELTKICCEKQVCLRFLLARFSHFPTCSSYTHQTISFCTLSAPLLRRSLELYFLPHELLPSSFVLTTSRHLIL